MNEIYNITYEGKRTKAHHRAFLRKIHEPNLSVASALLMVGFISNLSVFV